MFFKDQNKSKKSNVEAWARENFSGVPKKAIRAAVSDYIDTISNDKKTLEKSGMDPVDVFTHLYRAIVSHIDNLPDQVKKELACREGCAYCCKSEEINVSVEELMMMAVELIALDARIATPIIAKLATSAPTSNANTQGPGTPCAFLVNDSCSIYSSRPLSCRSYLSKDVDPCKQRLERPLAGTSIPKVLAPFGLRIAEMSFWEVVKPNPITYEVNSAFKHIFADTELTRKLFEGTLNDKDMKAYRREIPHVLLV